MKLNKYIKKNGKEYRLGFTTGSAAAAAAKAAVQILFKQQEIKEVELLTPAGIKLKLEPANINFNKNSASVTITKDAGDDPDVTDKIAIIATAELLSQKELPAEIIFEKYFLDSASQNFTNKNKSAWLADLLKATICFAEVGEPDKKNNAFLTAGRGIGRVSRPGLKLKPGQVAINPIPRLMIKKAVQSVLPPAKTIKVTISVPAGKKVAQKTFNSKLGILAGISLLGTTGIVEPMSESAYRESLSLELRQAAAEGIHKFVLVFGNHGKELALKMGYVEDQIIRMSNFVGYLLDHCQGLAISEILMIGHVGKIIKVAAGIFNTHSKVADARREIIAAYAALAGADQELIIELFNKDTAELAALYLKEQGLISKVLQPAAVEIAKRVQARLAAVEVDADVKAAIFTFADGIVAVSEPFDNFNCC